MKLLDRYKDTYEKRNEVIYTLEEYLKEAKKDHMFYAGAAERLLKAIGEPELIDTSKNDRLNRIFGSRIIKFYKVFADFYGMEEVIERLVSYLKHSAQGMEESRAIFYLLGPVASAKSSLAERLKLLMQQYPIYVLTDAEGNLSPTLESPLGLFNVDDAGTLKIPERCLKSRPSGWALKRLDEYEGDLSKFKVTRVFPDQYKQIGVATTVASDQQNQDVSTLVGKLDIRKLETFEQKDPDAYSYSGGLSQANQGLLDFVEMFKAKIDVLNPLLTATQEHYYEPTEKIGLLPFDGIIMAHSNESEWQQFKENKANEALLDRIFIVEVPYCLRVNEEVQIYKKLLDHSELNGAPTAPETLEILARFFVLTRLESPTGEDTPDESKTSYKAKMRVYNGEDLKNRGITALSFPEYRQLASKDEGFAGLSVRLAEKVLAAVYNNDPEELAADPVTLFKILKDTIYKERFPESIETTYNAFLTEILEPDYVKVLEKKFQSAYLDSYHEYGQNRWERYFLFADHYIREQAFRDPDTGQMYDREALNKELEKIEKPAKIANPTDFRHDVVNYCIRYRADHAGKTPDWTEYTPIKRVIEANMFSKVSDLLPVISFTGHKNKADQERHNVFIDNMLKEGFTKKQIKIQVDWYAQMTNT